MHHVLDVVPVSHKVNTQQAGVAVGGVEGLEAVTQVLLYCQASQAAAQMLQEHKDIHILSYMTSTVLARRLCNIKKKQRNIIIKADMYMFLFILELLKGVKNAYNFL